MKAKVKEIVERLVIESTLKNKPKTEEEQTLVYKCCGKESKPIKNSGLCPWCNSENIELVSRWKYILIAQILQAFKDILPKELPESNEILRSIKLYNKTIKEIKEKII